MTSPGPVAEDPWSIKNLFAGSSFQTANFFNGSDPQGWAECLTPIREPGQRKLAAPPAPALERARMLLNERRILVLPHATTRGDEACSALLHLVHDLMQRMPSRSVWSGDFDSRLPLHTLAQETNWPSLCRGALVYLSRGDDPKCADLLRRADDTALRRLRHTLEARDCTLLVSVAMVAPTPPTWPDDGAAGYWPFDAAIGDPPAAPPLASSFDTLVRAAAALFPGLPPQEFAALIDTLRGPGAVRPPATDTGSAPATIDSRAERWERGEADAVLAELGLRLGPAPDRGVADGPAGIHLDEAHRASHTADWAMKTLPILLSSRFEALTQRYFQPAAGPRYRSAYLHLVTRLQLASLRHADADWLLRTFARQAEAAPADFRPQDFCNLVSGLGGPVQDEAFVRGLAGGLAAHVADQEDRLLASVGPELDHLLAAMDGTPPWRLNTVFWSSLQHLDGAVVHRTFHRQVAGLLTLLLYWPAERTELVLDAVRHALGESPESGRAWRSLLHREPWLAKVTRIGELALQNALGEALAHSPSAWLRIASALAQPTAGLDTTRQQTARWLAQAQLRALWEHLQASNEPDRIDPSHRGLLLGDEQARLVQALGGLLATACRSAPQRGAAAAPPTSSLDDHGLVRLLRTWLRLMLRDGRAPAAAAERLRPALAPLRAALSAEHRRALAGKVQEAIDAERAREARARTSTDADARTERDEARRCTQALQALLSALRGFGAAA